MAIELNEEAMAVPQNQVQDEDTFQNIFYELNAFLGEECAYTSL